MRHRRIRSTEPEDMSKRRQGKAAHDKEMHEINRVVTERMGKKRNTKQRTAKKRKGQ